MVPKLEIELYYARHLTSVSTLLINRLMATRMDSPNALLLIGHVRRPKISRPVRFVSNDSDTDSPQSIMVY